MISYRNAQQVITTEEIRDMLLVVRRRNGDVADPSTFQESGHRRKGAASNGDDSFNPIPGGYVTCIDGLLSLPTF